MNIKKIIKRMLYPLQCLRYRIKNHKGFLYIGKGCKIVNPSRMYFGHNVSIMPYNMLVCHNSQSKLFVGGGTEIGMFSRIGCLNSIEIGEHVLTGPHIFIADYNHEYEDPTVPIMLQGNHVDSTETLPNGGVKIGDDTWIGTNVVIAGTIEIGKHCIIGANSVVTHDIPEYSVAVGIPCNVIKRFDEAQNKWVKC